MERKIALLGLACLKALLEGHTQTQIWDAGTNIVRFGQPLGVVATYILDPRSDDGLVAWNIGNRVANNQLASSLARIATPPPASCGIGPS